MLPSATSISRSVGTIAVEARLAVPGEDRVEATTDHARKDPPSSGQPPDHPSHTSSPRRTLPQPVAQTVSLRSGCPARTITMECDRRRGGTGRPSARSSQGAMVAALSHPLLHGGEGETTGEPGSGDWTRLLAGCPARTITMECDRRRGGTGRPSARSSQGAVVAALSHPLPH